MAAVKEGNMRVTIFSIFVGILVFTPPAYGTGKDNDAAAFWHTFRAAVLQGHYDTIAKMTRFPLQVKGADDSTPAKDYAGTNFPIIFEQILDQPVSLLSNGKIVTKSMLEAIRAKKELVPTDFKTPTTIRIFQLQFKRFNGRWFLTRAYLEEY